MFPVESNGGYSLLDKQPNTVVLSLVVQYQQYNVSFLGYLFSNNVYVRYVWNEFQSYTCDNSLNNENYSEWV